MVWDGIPLTSGKKGSRAQTSHVMWETAGEGKKGIAGSRGRKTAEETRAQSPKSKWRNGGDPLSPKKKTHTEM